MQGQVRNLCYLAVSITGEPNSSAHTLKQSDFTNSLIYDSADLNAAQKLQILEDFCNDANTLTKTKSQKRKLQTTPNVPLKNKYHALTDLPTSGDVEDMDAASSAGPSTQSDITTNTKKNIHPFFVEFEGIHWTEIASAVKNLESVNPPAVSLNGELLKILPKSEDQFRNIQRYLDSKNLKYTTLPPKDRRPIKICVRGIPPDTDPKIIIDDFKKLNFTATRAAMLKNKKTGRGMPLYMVNILPNKNLDKLYEITEICNIHVVVERFRNNNNIKQCYRCQAYGHASEICNLSPKCVKCAGDHLTKECPQHGRITPTCANCGLQHPASYRGCSKNPKNIRKKSFQRNNSPKSTIAKDFIEIMKDFNYTNKPTPSTNPPTISDNQEFPPLADTGNPINPPPYPINR